MDVRKFVIKETGIIAAGECVCVAVMIAVFALLGMYDGTVLTGGLIGGILAIGNFFFMAIAANAAADAAAEQDVKAGKARIRSSYLMRMVILFVILFACVKGGLCNPFAMVIPFLFVRPVITVAEFFRKSGDKKNECER